MCSAYEIMIHVLILSPAKNKDNEITTTLQIRQTVTYEFSWFFFVKQNLCRQSALVAGFPNNSDSLTAQDGTTYSL